MTQTKVIASNFEMSSGDSKLLTITTLDQDDAVVDITGASISMVIAKRVNTTALVTKAGTIINAVGGVFTIDLLPADTDALSGVYYFEMQLTDASGRISTVVYGSLTIRQDAITP